MKILPKVYRNPKSARRRKRTSRFGITMAKGYLSNSVPRGNRAVKTNYPPLSKEIFALIIAAFAAFSERQRNTVWRLRAARPVQLAPGWDAAASILYLRISTLRLGTGRDFIYSRPHGISGSHLIPGAPGLSSAAARRESISPRKLVPSLARSPRLAFGDSPEVLRFGARPIRDMWFTPTITIDFKLRTSLSQW